jgi:hypothetical protein
VARSWHQSSALEAGAAFEGLCAVDARFYIFVVRRTTLTDETDVNARKLLVPSRCAR